MGPPFCHGGRMRLNQRQGREENESQQSMSTLSSESSLVLAKAKEGITRASNTLYGMGPMLYS